MENTSNDRDHGESGKTLEEMTRGQTSATGDERYWRVERAEKFSLIIDACAYFICLRKVMISARQQLMLIGWDFDLEIEMLPGESDEDGIAPDGFPNKLGPFIEAVIEHNPDLEIYMLKWNGAPLVAPGRLAPTLAFAAFANARIHFTLDGHHPFGACHHQKIVVADDNLAFCGGIDATEDRWDTSEHLPDDPRRQRKDGSPSEPWHDAATAMTGPAATALGELARARWKRAGGDPLERPAQHSASLWPSDFAIDARDIDVAIARTEPPFDGGPLINEIEQSLLHAIRNAKDNIYIESQYFTAETVCAALEDRLRETGGPDVIIINPKSAESKFEDDAMHSQRDRMLERLKGADHEDRFGMFYPVTTAEQPIYVHAKIFVADTSVLNIGSANMSNRSLGFDTECNIVIMGQEKLIGSYRTRLLSEHLNVSTEEFEAVLKHTGRLTRVIKQLNKDVGRGLREIEDRDFSWRDTLLADTQIMDPRFMPGQTTSTGEGIRPRHIAIVAGVALIGYLGWLALRKGK